LVLFLVVIKVICLNALTLTVTVKYPQNQVGSSQLYLRGDNLGLSWSEGELLEYDNDNSWSVTLEYDSSHAGEQLQMKVLVDDTTWQLGANSQVEVPSESSSVILYPFFYSTTGEYLYETGVFSPQLNNTRDLVIYTPPSYVENPFKTIRYVLVMHDGQNLFNVSTCFLGVCWYCQNTIDLLVNEGAIDELVIIGVDNTPDRIDELTYSYDPTEKAGGKGDLYLDFIQDTVLPLVQLNYRINIEQSTLGILGSSLGGLISCYAGWTRSDIYGKAGCMSSSFWWNSEDFNNVILVKNPPPDNLEVYLDSGNAGPDNDDEAQTIRVRNHIQSLGYVMNQTLFYYLDNGGQHNEYYWGHRFWIPMTYLFPVLDIPTTPNQ